MLLEPKFDDPARVADYGFFANERLEPVVLTGSDLADAIESGVAPDGAPFSDWIHKPFEGCRFTFGPEEARIMLKAWLLNGDAYSGVMDILNDVAYENYGAGA